MPTSPNSPTAHPHLPSTPTSSKRAPQRLKLTPKRQLQTPKRLPPTPQQPTKPMTPKRNPQTTPRASRRKTTDGDATPLKTPRRNKDVPAARVASTHLHSAKPAQRSKVDKETPTVEKKDIITSSPSQNKLQEKKKRKLELNAGKSKKQQLNKNSETYPEPSQKVPSSAKKANSSTAEQHSVLRKSSSKKSSKSSKERDVDDKSKATAETIAERVDSAKNMEETPKKQKSKKKRPAPGKFDLPSQDDDRKETSSAKRAKKRAHVGKEAAILSPKITVNESMSESKLQLLESSPLNRLIAENDRKAAAAEVAAQRKAPKDSGKKGDGLSTSASFIPIDRPTADTDRVGKRDTPKTDGKKQDGKKKGKGKDGRKGGSVLDEDNPESVNKGGVMYLGHIPHGFYEKEMRAYFSQFGTVTQLKLSRSKKTGGSRGYAFLQFEDPAVASIAAEAMDGYLMHGQSLVAKVVPEDKVHPETFKDADKKFKKIPWSSIERRKMIARAKDPLKLALRSRRVKKVTKNRMKQLSKKGIKYDFPEISA